VFPIIALPPCTGKRRPSVLFHENGISICVHGFESMHPIRYVNPVGAGPCACPI
jgi:hypothetical protein